MLPPPMNIDASKNCSIFSKVTHWDNSDTDIFQISYARSELEQNSGNAGLQLSKSWNSSKLLYAGGPVAEMFVPIVC